MGHEPRDSWSKEQPGAQYANYFEVGHNAFEFVLDFGQFYPEGEPPRVHTRIVTTPTYAKALLETLQESIHSYEATFGPIPELEAQGRARKASC